MARTTTLKGNPFNLAGPELKVGDKAPDATVRKGFVDDMKLSEHKGQARIYSVVPSLDTPVCADQTRRFWKEATALPNVKLFTVSCDLPPAQARFCSTEGIDTEKVKPLSDHKDLDFGTKYGTLIPDLRLQSRAVFVVDQNDVIRYAEYVPEIASHPNYEAVLAAAKGL
ncbi:MAG: thiol peroxidase [Phycisphaerae bacterium]